MKTTNNTSPYILKGTEVRDGAGVRILRLFGSTGTFNFTDPFLLLDFFGSNNPDEYLMGFPWHPHRGIETLTYLISGSVEHEDSLGNSGKLRSGEIQWMTAGSGIFHQEMPKPEKNNPEMFGFQLWINLPKARKFSKPVYRNVGVSKLKSLKFDGVEMKIISGSYQGNPSSALEDHPLNIEYLDVVSNGRSLAIKKKSGFTGLVIPVDGEVLANGATIKKGETGVFTGNESSIEIESKNRARFVYISGARTNENIAWYGPIVMNNWSEIEQAFDDLRNGKFVRDSSPTFISY
ncbi:MAG: pirin family protein [Thermoplasmatales archaeon]